MNPQLKAWLWTAFWGLLAAGIDGIEQAVVLHPATMAQIDWRTLLAAFAVGVLGYLHGLKTRPPLPWQGPGAPQAK